MPSLGNPHYTVQLAGLIRSAGRRLTCLEHNRHVNPDRTENILLDQVDIHQTGRPAHLKCCGMIKAFKIVRTNADIEYRAGSGLIRLEYVPGFHGGVKQLCGIECR